MAIQFRIFVTVGRVSVDVQIVRRPLFAVRHPLGGIDRAGLVFAVLPDAMATGRGERDQNGSGDHIRELTHARSLK
jgi:hypothetical protein